MSINIALAQSAVAAVGGEIVAATRAADEAVIRSANCISTFVTERAKKNLQLDIGLEALMAVHTALGSALVSRRDSIRARQALVQLPKLLEVEGYGNMCPCGETAVEMPSVQLVAAA